MKRAPRRRLPPCFLLGGPLNRQHLQVSAEVMAMNRLEVRITSENGDPVPRAWQKVAIYAKREGKPLEVRYFIGMADEA